MIDLSGQPKLRSSSRTWAFASSFPHMKTLCSPDTRAGSTITSHLIVFRALTTLASGNSRWMELGQMRTKAANLYHVRGGKVTRLVIYMDRERAFADLGLPSEAGSPRS